MHASKLYDRPGRRLKSLASQRRRLFKFRWIEAQARSIFRTISNFLCTYSLRAHKHLQNHDTIVHQFHSICRWFMRSTDARGRRRTWSLFKCSAQESVNHYRPTALPMFLMALIEPLNCTSASRCNRTHLFIRSEKCRVSQPYSQHKCVRTRWLTADQRISHVIDDYFFKCKYTRLMHCFFHTHACGKKVRCIFPANSIFMAGASASSWP